MSLQTNGKSDCSDNFGSCSYDSEGCGVMTNEELLIQRKCSARSFEGSKGQ